MRKVHEQVKVIRHQAERMNLDPEQLVAFVHDREEPIAVRLDKEGSLTIGSPIHHVVPAIFGIKSNWSRHTDVWTESVQDGNELTMGV